MSDDLAPGVYFDLPDSAYRSVRALSQSAMKKLSVSPLHYWHTQMNPDYERPEETVAQRFGKAADSLLLEPSRFFEEYVRKVGPEDYPDCLQTVEDMKAWLAEQNLPVSAKRKEELIQRIEACGVHPVLWDSEKARIAEETAGKVTLSKDEWKHLMSMKDVAEADPFVTGLFSEGMPQVSFIVRDPNSGELLKARMDWVKTVATIDVKTFNNSRGKRTEKAVFDALYYEGYHFQAAVYKHIREVARQQLISGEIQTFGNVSEAWLKAFLENDNHGFGLLFIESAEPFDMRFEILRQREAQGGAENVYWVAAESRMRDMIALYQECVARYGDKPWREPVKPHVLSDTDIPQLLFAA